MPVFNYAARELILKIVYYGPALCGKTTNLEYIYAQLPPDKKGKMLSLATESDRTLFFDFLPIDLGTLQGWRVRVQLYTVPGQVFYDATRRLVLKGADGIVFVVDSQREMLESNLESWENMKANLAHNGLDFWNVPLVVQYNKRDLQNVLPVPTLEARINERQAPYFEAIAIQGTGVMETLREAVKRTLQAVQQRIARPEAPTPLSSEVSPRISNSPPPPPVETPFETPTRPTADLALTASPPDLGAPESPPFESIDEMIELQPIEEVIAEPLTPPEPPVLALADMPAQEPMGGLESPLPLPESPPSPESVPPPPEPPPPTPTWTVDAHSEPVTVEVTSSTEGLHIRLTLHITLHLVTRTTDGSAE